MAQGGVGGRPTIPALDGLRGTAALIVVVSHYSNESALWHGLLGHGAGQCGVMLFFMLSGFLMAHLHIDQAFVAANVGQYAVRRFARVYPMFAIAAFLWPLHDLIWGGAGRVAILVAYLRQIALLDPGVSIFWTIRVEIIFYAVFVGLWGLHRRLGNRIATVVILLAAVAGLTAAGYTYGNGFLGTARYFLFGVVSAVLLRPGGGARTWGASVVPLLAFATLPLSFPLIARAVTGADIDPWRSNLVALQYIVVFNLVLRDRLWLRGVLSSAPARWVGNVSYSIYLLHTLVMTAVFALVGQHASHAVSLALVLAGTLAIAGLSYRSLERPLQRLVLRGLGRGVARPAC
ncbi:MAG: acyltransferase [Rhodospirillales bacterium]